jgi:flagellar M-ring protein FliF
MMQVDTSAVTPATGIPGETSNVAPQDTVLVDANVVSNDSDSTNIRSSQTTRNYEVDREIQYQKSSSGDITKLSVAVVLNRNAISELTLGNEGSTDAFDVSGIRSLVASAVGIDESRGDSIMVLVSQFRGEDSEADVIWYENNSIRNYATMGLALVGFILFLLMVIKPIIVGIYGRPVKPGTTQLLEKTEGSEDEALTDAEIAEMGIYSNVSGSQVLRDGEKVLRSEDDIKARAEETGESLEELKARLTPRKSNVSADMFDTANTYDDKVNIVRMLVDEDSSRVASLLKKMVASKSAPT